jgi:thiol-disulfide isomerase/thioredoxin
MTPARREALFLTVAGLAAAAAGFLVGPAFVRRESGADRFLGARFLDLQGKSRQFTEWQGKVLVCNFWATWCAPCREEMPLLAATRQKYAPNGVEIVGIAVDNAAKVGQFTTSLKIPYPILLSEADGLEHMRRLGNSSGGLPYTVFFDREGRVAHRKLGALKQEDLEGILGSLLKG